MFRQISEPEMPKLAGEISFGRVAQLVQGFQIAEDLRSPLPANV
jgi:hypothetical protein